MNSKTGLFETIKPQEKKEMKRNERYFGVLRNRIQNKYSSESISKRRKEIIFNHRNHIFKIIAVKF